MAAVSTSLVGTVVTTAISLGREVGEGLLMLAKHLEREETGCGGN